MNFPEIFGQETIRFLSLSIMVILCTETSTRQILTDIIDNVHFLGNLFTLGVRVYRVTKLRRNVETSNVTSVTVVRSASARLFEGAWRPLVSVITTFYYLAIIFHRRV